jgi:hypothetical protein
MIELQLGDPQAIGPYRLQGRIGAGDADPSGDAYPANAVLTYTNDPAESTGNFWSSWFETCTLPYSQQALCTAVLNDFASRYKDS